MRIEDILIQITAESNKIEIDKINKTILPTKLITRVNSYREVGGKRDDFFWKWIYRAILETTYPLIPSSYQDCKITSEFLLVMFIVLLDDLVDNHQGEVKLIDNLFSIPQNSCMLHFRAELKKDKYCEFSLGIWDEVLLDLKTLPRYSEFEEIFHFDVEQIINALKYDYLVNKNPFLINKDEFWLYSPHTMQIVASVMLDLMCVPTFDSEELGIVRGAAIKAQKMARIGNWISTWEREIDENDFTSGVFAYLVKKKSSHYKYLAKENKLKILKIIKKYKIEKDLLMEWIDISKSLEKDCKLIESIKVDKFKFGQERLLIMYLASKKVI